MQNIKILGAPKDLLNEDIVFAMLLQYASEDGFTIDTLEYNFVDSEKMHSLNKKYLDHSTDTDIITFDYSVENEISAEAFISHEALELNAQKHNQSVEKETLRLVSHALLHCFGYKDKSQDEKSLMRLKEEECIAMFHVKQ